MSAERKYLLSAVTAFLRPTRAGARRYRQATQNARESGWRGLTPGCLSWTLRTRTQNIGGWLQKAAPDRRIRRAFCPMVSVAEHGAVLREPDAG